MIFHKSFKLHSVLLMTVATVMVVSKTVVVGGASFCGGGGRGFPILFLTLVM
uniref:Transmembrane protein n=1 Tax=Medicago truncatula TaxID=3880 RepID=A2Q4Z1_MEDTR|nr:hypothetical protein MtrDRAFT_AC157893g30v2 [Medicago truncatula]